MKAQNIKVIFDTNVWISFLIGKRLSFVKSYISSGQITHCCVPFIRTVFKVP